MPRISGQYGARISTSSPGLAMAPIAAPSAPVAPALTSTASRSQGSPLRARTFSTMASTSSGTPRAGQ
jgi:hypothetical protein